MTEKFNMQTQPQLLMLQKTMVVVEGVARKLNPNTNICTTSKTVLEHWLIETKDPINTITDTLSNTSEVIKRLPDISLTACPNIGSPIDLKAWAKSSIGTLFGTNPATK